MNPALAAVLARPDVWRGETPAVTSLPAVPSGEQALDALLPGGGWPRGQLVEVMHGAPGAGELALLLPALASLASGGRIVLVMPPYLPHAPAWVMAGVPVASLCLIRPRLARSGRDALWATVEALRCPGVAATLAWLDPLSVNSVRRLHLAAGEGGGCAFLFRPAAAATVASPAPLRLLLEAERGGVRVTLLKRRGAPAGVQLRLDPCRPVRLSHALAGAASAGGREPVRA